MKHKILTSLVVFFGISALPLAAFAQPQPAPLAIDAEAKREAVETAARILRSRYIFPDIAEQAAAAIETALADGSYDGLDDQVAFATELTDDLQAIANDKHLRVSAPGSPPPRTTSNPGPRPRDEGGITRADILPDNIGYLEVVGFPGPAAFNPASDRAMAALEGTRALIIDVRRNGGGSPVSVSYLVSYFLAGDEPVHINTFVNRTPDTETFTTTEFWSETTPFRYTDKPVYVLTSDFTFSGGEEFAYDMQVMDLAELIGDTTGGGANPGGTTSIGSSLMMFVPGGRAENPITGTNWEGVGVIPDVAVPSGDALSVALERLGVSPALADIEAASVARVFEPAPLRTEAQAGGAATIRRISGELARGEPDYELMTERIAEVTRTQLPMLQERMSALGAIESVTFVRVNPDNSDLYEARYAEGGLNWRIVLDEEGRIASVGIQPLAEEP